MTLSAYAALLLAMPVILYQLYAYVLPAFSPHESGSILPFMLMVPFLFIGGVVFAYFVVVPAATSFLLNFNADEFNIEVRARKYYSFFALDPDRRRRAVSDPGRCARGDAARDRHARDAGAKPPLRSARDRGRGDAAARTDPVTMLISMLPLLLLFEFSLILARIFGGPREPEGEPAGPGEARLAGLRHDWLGSPDAFRPPKR